MIFRDGKHLTLKGVFESLNLSAYDLSIDTLDMHVSTTCGFVRCFNLRRLNVVSEMIGT